MKSVLGTALLVMLFATGLVTVRADDLVRSTQEELRRRNIYYGEIDGTQSPELTSALKQYQSEKGFAATGEMDKDTLRSLDLLPKQPGEAPPKELPWPSEPVLQSDAMVNVPAIAQQISQDTGVAPSTIEPASATQTPSGKHRHPRAPEDTAEASPEPSSHVHIRNAKPPPIGEFLHSYLRAIGRNDLRDEIRFYADQVNYFHNGKLDRRIVERVLNGYDKQWTRRDYRVTGPVMYRFIPSTGQILVVYHLKFTLKGRKVVVKGETENRIVIDAATSDPRIISVEEQRVRG